MNITTEEQGGVSIIKLAGDLAGDSTFAQKAGELLASADHKVVIDLSDVGMVTSAGLGDLVRITAQSNSQGGSLILANPAPFVAGVLETTKLNKFFDVRASLDEAIRALQ